MICTYVGMHVNPFIYNLRYWDMIQRLKVNQFYTAPTASKEFPYLSHAFYV